MQQQADGEREDFSQSLPGISIPDVALCVECAQSSLVPPLSELLWDNMRKDFITLYFSIYLNGCTVSFNFHGN